MKYISCSAQTRRIAGPLLASLMAACGGGDGAPLDADCEPLTRTEAAQTAAAPTTGTAPLAWQDRRLPVALEGRAYTGQLTAAGGRPPYRFVLGTGALPPGLGLDEASGRVSGQALAAGRYRAVITLSDAAGASLLQETIEIVVGRTSAGSGEPRREQRAQTEAATLDGLLASIAAMPERGWQKLNANRYADVWTPEELRPQLGLSNPSPASIILAWSSFAWDSNRARLVLYGGGHANYRGNDVYTWDAASRLWQRASLPSAMVSDSLGNWNAVDGVANAPASAHTYDSSMYFPLIDRVVVLGGAADPNGGHFLTQATATTSRVTGPYLFDPARADGNKVGGTTGSHVTRVAPFSEIVGGRMWSNRESWLHASASSTPPTENFIDGCSGTAVEGGTDVGYVRTAHRLYRYTIHDLNNPTLDTWEQVGRYWTTGSGGQSTCAYDTARQLFVVAASSSVTPFVYWDLRVPGPANNEVAFMPVDPSGEFERLLAAGAINLRLCALEYDRQRADHKLWCGDGRVWTLTPPQSPGPTGWTITRADAQTPAAPSEDVGTGILGKWKYIPNLDVFMGLADPVEGNVWIYKPAGWVHPSPPANLPPRVSLEQPQEGATFAAGTPITVAATASDDDGSVARVEFYAGSTKIGEDTTAPYSLQWSGAAVGLHVLTATAFDSAGASTVSAARTVGVEAAVPANQPPSVGLVQPLQGAAFVAGTPILIEATAADGDGNVVRVDFYANQVKIGEDAQAPYAYTWNGAATGGYTLTAVALDNQGASSTSNAHGITVTAAANETPTASLSQPLVGASFTVGQAILIEALASDGDGSIARVEFYAGSTKIGEDSQAPYALQWIGAPAGSHLLRAVAIDNLGASVSSAPHPITVAAGNLSCPAPGTRTERGGR
jgi:hypothetical protein